MTRLTRDAGMDLTSTWDMDLDVGTFVWRGKKGKVLSAVQMLGTRNQKANTWLWAWANQSIPPQSRTASLKVREFGLAKRCEPLTEAKIYCGVDQMWAFCHLAIGLGLGSFVYQAVRGVLEMYLLLTDPWVEPY
jgi:hypothetical protein